MRSFDYLQRVVVDAQLEIDDIGKCCLLANNDFGEEFYLIIVTELGSTEIIEYGPMIPDFPILQTAYHIDYQRIDYNEGRIERAIDKFLNNPKRAISQARVVSFEEIADNLINPIHKLSYQGSLT